MQASRSKGASNRSAALIMRATFGGEKLMMMMMVLFRENMKKKVKILLGKNIQRKENDRGLRKKTLVVLSVFSFYNFVSPFQ
jgi:hypothetical protein